MQDEKLLELKTALDASYLSKQKDYELLGFTKEDFYKSAFNRIEPVSYTHLRAHETS